MFPPLFCVTVQAAKEERIVSIPEVIGTGGEEEDVAGAAAELPTFFPTWNPTRLPTRAEIPEEEAAAAEEEDVEEDADDEDGEDEEEYLEDDAEEEEYETEEEAADEAEEEEEEEAAAVAGIVASPAAAYEDLAWADLPDDVQEAMAALGYTPEIWDGNGVSDADNLDWDELDEAELEAAEALGYDEEAWMTEDEEAVAAVVSNDGVAVAAVELEAEDLTAHPATAPPSPHPTRALPPCPRPFNPTVEYAGGDVAEVDGHVFRCNHHENGAYVRYCNILHWDEALLEYDPRAQELWEGAWVHLGGCGSSAAAAGGARR